MIHSYHAIYPFNYFRNIFRPRGPDVKLETRLNIKDLEALQDAFMV